MDMLCRSCLRARAIRSYPNRDASLIGPTHGLLLRRRLLHTPRPRIDFKRIRDDPDAVVRECKQRRVPIDKAHVQRCVAAYDRFTKGTADLNDCLSRRNALTKSIKDAKSGEQRQALIDEAAALKPKVQDLQKAVDEAESEMTTLALVLPNAHSEHTPVGDESKVRILSYINEENQYRSEEELVAPPPTVDGLNTRATATSDAAALDKAIKDTTATTRQLDHVALCKRFDLVDFDTASRCSGSGFYYLKNAAVSLELALVQLALSRAVVAGFQLYRPPDLVRSEFVTACGFSPRDTEGQVQVYETFGEFEKSLSLAGTAEIPLAALGLDAVFNPGDLPRKIAGHGRAFRREAGARGADTRGLYRVHEFTKVELFAFARPGRESETMYDGMLSLQRSIVRDLGLCARVLEMPTAELGASAFRKADIEAWIPSRGVWGEVSSLSNCTDYQSRRLNSRFRRPPPPPPSNTTTPSAASVMADGDAGGSAGGLEFVHTLNGTGVAVPRLLVSALETWYDPRKDVIVIPDVLRPYMGGLETIERP